MPEKLRVFALLVLATVCACSKKDGAPTSAASSATTLPTSAPVPADMKAEAKEKSKDEAAPGKASGGKKSDSPKTWKRAGAAAHAARVAIGDKESLPVRAMQLKVDIDGFRARVVVDAYFENDRDRSYEGTFQLRLPDGASPYFFAFGETAWEKPAPADFEKVAFSTAAAQRAAGTTPEAILSGRKAAWREPREARVVPKEKAALAYTETARRAVDPALLEWAGAGVFNARVFPIAPKKLHRVVVGYDVNLVRAGDDLEYQLELPAGVEHVTADLSSAGPAPAVEPKLATASEGGRSYLHVDSKDERAFKLRFPRASGSVIVGEDGEAKRFAADVVADLPATAGAAQDRAVFVVDTSLSSNPDRFAVFGKLVAATLAANRATLKRFAVLFFDVQTTWWRSEWTDNTPENADKLAAHMDTLSLEGATDLGAALAQAGQPSWAGDDRGTWDTFLLSDGAATWGESDKNLVVAGFTRARRGPVFAYQTGLAGTEGAALAHLARETGGAVFSVVGEDEIAKASTAHRARPYRLVAVKGEGADDVLVAGRPRYVYPGQSLGIVGRGSPKGLALVVAQGDKEQTVSLKLAPAKASPLAARAYGQVATAALEELGQATAGVAKAYAIHHRVTGETCSLVMLESEADYARFGIRPEQERQTVQETLASKTLTKVEAELEGSLADPKAYVLRWLSGLEQKPGVTLKLSSDVLAAVGAMPRASFVVTPRPLEVKSRTKDALPPDLREKVSMRAELEYEALTAEASARKQRHGAGDALRALSSLVEQSPGDGILARDVGFTAMELGLPDQAFFLFRRVADARPWEPQSYKAMADVLARTGNADLAMVYYEVALQGHWDARFGEFHRIAAVDYVRFLRRVAKGELSTSAQALAKERLARVSDEVALGGADLVIVITWNTDSSDVDLHVVEPTGEECFFQNRKTKIGGELTMDVTQGYGPEMYVLPKAKAGKYKVHAHYYAQPRSRASARTKVYAEIIEGWGTPGEKVTEKVVTLAEGKEDHPIVEIAR
jgi:Mg-chelatase subunit ChlD/tetratricopeptide (TPR) repeat protein